MECFYHEGIQACGVCKSCNRGICRECVSEVKNGVACKNICESEAIELDRIISEAKKMVDSANTMINSASGTLTDVFYLIVGILFLGYGIYDNVDLLKYLGAIFILFGAIGLFRIFKAKDSTNA